MVIDCRCTNQPRKGLATLFAPHWHQTYMYKPTWLHNTSIYKHTHNPKHLQHQLLHEPAILGRRLRHLHLPRPQQPLHPGVPHLVGSCVWFGSARYCVDGCRWDGSIYPYQACIHAKSNGPPAHPRPPARRRPPAFMWVGRLECIGVNPSSTLHAAPPPPIRIDSSPIRASPIRSVHRSWQAPPYLGPASRRAAARRRHPFVPCRPAPCLPLAPFRPTC